MKLCEYGCGREAKYPPRKGNPKWTCEYNRQNCPVKYHRRSDDEVEKILNSKGFIWIVGDYKNEMSIITVKCSNGHKFNTTLNNINIWGKCKECNNFTYWTIEKVKEFSEKRNYKCLSDSYKTTNHKIKLQCIFGHVFDIRWDVFTGGAECPKCMNIQKMIKFSGEGNPNWKGGIQNLPYCELWSNMDFKESIKFRDGYQCLNPCCNKKSAMLVVHHIDYKKENCEKNNLITLCNSCNVSANYNRHWYEMWYKIILHNRYNI